MTKPKGPQVREFSEVHARWQNLFDALNNDSDLICAIVATSYLNDILGGLLHKFFIDCGSKDRILKPDAGLLGSLRSKADIAYCLGLIPKPRLTAIQQAAEIRNAFAHTDVELRFASEELREKCGELLKWSQQGIKTQVIADDPELLQHMMAGTPRRQFVTAMQTLCVYTMFDAMQVEQRLPHITERPASSDHPSGASLPTE